MSNEKRIEFEYFSGLSLEVLLLAGSGLLGTVLDDADGVFRDAPADDKVPALEHLVANGFFRDIPGTYVLLESRAVWPDGVVTWKANVVGDATVVRSGSLTLADDATVLPAAQDSAGEKRIEFEYEAGLSMELLLLHGTGLAGTILDNTDGVFRSAPLDDKVPVPEHLIANGFFRDIPGTYVLLESRAPGALWPDGAILWKANVVGNATVVVSGSLAILNVPPVVDPADTVTTDDWSGVVSAALAPHANGYKFTLDDGLPTMSYDSDTTIATDLLLSALVPQGSFFFDTAFGLRELPKKITEESLGLVENAFRESAKWLQDAGKATSLDVVAEFDEHEKNRVDVQESAVQANDEPVEFQTFVPVV